MERIFVWLLFTGLGVCLIFGHGAQAFAAAGDAAGEAVTLTVGLVGGCALWGGLVAMADAAGLSRGAARAMRPFLRWIFPNLEGNPEARQAVATAFSANLLGLGNAATPLALNAMKHLNGRDADTFWLISASSLQLLPTTVLAMRQTAGAANPGDILPICIAASAMATAVAVAIRPREKKGHAPNGGRGQSRRYPAHLHRGVVDGHGGGGGSA